MQNAITKAVMLDTENVFAVYFGSNRQIRTDAIAEASHGASPTGAAPSQLLSSAKRLFDWTSA